MKLAGRQLVEGTSPRLYIGHRVHRDPKSGKECACRLYVAEWSHEGKKFCERLKTTNRQVAIRRAHAICERIGRGETAAPPSVSIETLVQEYLDALKGKARKKGTVDKYTDVLEVQFLEFLKSQRITAARQFGEAHFWGFSQHLIEKPVAPKTSYIYLIVVKQMWRHAERTGRIAKNPVAACAVPKPPDTHQLCPTPEQVGLLLTRADPHLKPFLTFLAYEGVRFGEAAQLRGSDIEFGKPGEGFVKIKYGGGGGTTKSGKARSVPLHPEVRKILTGLPRHATSPLVFRALPSKKYPEGDGPISERRTLRAFKRLCKRCELAEWKNFTLHSLRHFFASSLARRQISYKYALSFMGHSSSKILDIYYAMFDRDAQEAILSVQVVAPKAVQKEVPGAHHANGADHDKSKNSAPEKKESALGTCN